MIPTKHDSIALINGLDWSQVEPEHLIQISLNFAIEFAQTVHDCIPTYHSNPLFQEFISGEIATNNLQYEDYHKTADHWEFLFHFVDNKTIALKTLLDLGVRDSHLFHVIKDYLQFVRPLPPDEKLATLVSREHELHGIFENMLDAHDWESLGYGFFSYFLERHIQLDSEDGGHDEIAKRLLNVKKFDKTLERFWYLRYQVYINLFK